MGLVIPRLTRLPRAWPRRIKRALLNITAIASSILTRTTAMAADSPLARVKLRAKVTQLEAEVGLLKEEIRIKDERLRQSRRRSDLTIHRSRAWRSSGSERPDTGARPRPPGSSCSPGPPSRAGIDASTMTTW